MRVAIFWPIFIALRAKNCQNWPKTVKQRPILRYVLYDYSFNTHFHCHFLLLNYFNLIHWQDTKLDTLWRSSPSFSDPRSPFQSGALLVKATCPRRFSPMIAFSVSFMAAFLFLAWYARPTLFDIFIPNFDMICWLSSSRLSASSVWLLCSFFSSFGTWLLCCIFHLCS